LDASHKASFPYCSSFVMPALAAASRSILRTADLASDCTPEDCVNFKGRHENTWPLFAQFRTILLLTFPYGKRDGRQSYTVKSGGFF
jgi:hypothetical protein